MPLTLHPTIPHKARIGAVRTRLTTDQDIQQAGIEVLKAATHAGATDARLLVQEMAQGAEVLLGGIIDDRFGPAITLRRGGADVESVAGRFVVAPITITEAERLVATEANKLGLDPQHHDLQSLVRAVIAMADLVVELQDRIVEIEANPLIVCKDQVVAVDALMVLRSA